MIIIPNYQITKKIYGSTNSLVYRGICSENNQPVIFKVLKEGYPTKEELTRYRQEYEITRNIKLPGVIKAYRLEKYQNTLIIILEDFGGESLKQLMAIPPSSFEKGGQWGILKGGISISDFLPLAIQIANSLDEIHAANIIHKDINPSNIVFNPDTNQLKIIDFGIASRLKREKTTLKNPEHLEGTLAYISPEQTGRINRSIDYRTDLYSLGVTFYEMLTGQQPFNSTDLLELVHCHIAKTPVPVCEINPNVPHVLSDIVIKLMAKNAEERYQSAVGLKFDLETCLKNLEGFQNLRGFSVELAQHDFCGRFQIPQKLYGREKEIQTLLQAFECVANPPQSSFAKGGHEFVLVAGYSGVGKSALVHEIHKAVSEKCGYFAAGKFDQYQRNIPYSALTKAFNELCNYWLTESTEQLKQWRNKILMAVGNNGQVLIDVIPHLELVIGSQPAVAHVGSQEAQNRFMLVFQNFMRAISKKNHPLVLFIDDLQWADSASLSLLQTLMTDMDNQYFLIIGAYRDNEVDASHPLMIMVENFKHSFQIPLHTIYLQNLTNEDVNTLIADALGCESAHAHALTNLVYEKTHGNAFFTHEFLKSLYEQALLEFDVKAQQWRWDVEQIAAKDMTDNVVELMTSKITQLPAHTQEVLKFAACIGNQFCLETLSIIRELPQKETLALLWKTIEEGLLVPLDDNYKHLEKLEKAIATTHFKFQHDRVQQAAYSLVADADKPNLHLQIGRLLLVNTKNLEERLFDIVDHFNLSLEQIKLQSEREEIIRLNLLAGQHAKAATAYEVAINYFNTGLELLTEDSWQTQYELTLALYVEAVETEYLNTHFEQVETLSQVVLQQAKTVLDKVKVYESQLLSHIAQNQMNAAIEIGLQVLEMLEVSLVKTPPENLIIETIHQLPEMDDPKKQAAMRFLMNLLAPVLVANPTLLPQIAFTMVNLCINYGNSPLAAFAYVFYGLLLCGGQKDNEKGYQFGKLALTMLEKFQTAEIKCKVHNLFYAFISHWKQPANESIASLLQTIQIGLETGDLEYASHAALNYANLPN
jgi:predicted ATPase